MSRGFEVSMATEEGDLLEIGEMAHRERHKCNPHADFEETTL
jgi:hypothetical protein